jgi:hypothetical protein
MLRRSMIWGLPGGALRIVRQEPGVKIEQNISC